MAKKKVEKAEETPGAFTWGRTAHVQGPCFVVVYNQYQGRYTFVSSWELGAPGDCMDIFPISVADKWYRRMT
jgi:hypothetical protein